jgi:hypothetical protein
VRLLDQGLHDRPSTLREQLQAQIDAIPPGDCDAILLVYGMCGLATPGLVARHMPMVIPRAHDCITLYLGSKARYQEEFEQEPGTYWYSVDYLERNPSQSRLGAGMPGLIDGLYEEYVQKYGQDNADYLMEVMGEWGKHYQRAVYIDTGLGDSTVFEQMAHEQAKRRGWRFEQREGNRRLVQMLVNGVWSKDEFLLVLPGYMIEQSHDGELIKAVPMRED